MPLAEGYKKEGAVRNPVDASAETQPKVKNNKTLAQLRINATDWDRFGKFLGEEDGAEEIAAKVVEGKADNLDREEIAQITELKEKFLILMERSDMVAETLDAGTIAELGKQFPDLQRLIEMNGPEGLRKALKNELPGMAITDPEHFGMLAENIENRVGAKKALQEREKTITAAFRELGITNEQEMIKLIHGDDPTEFAENLAEKGLGWFKRTFGVGASPEDVEKFRRKIADLATQSKSELDENIALIDQNMRTLAAALEMSVMDNPGVKKAFIANTYGEQMEKQEKDMSFAETKDAMKLDSKAAMAAWEQKRAAYETKNEQAIYDYYYKEWLENERTAGWDEYYGEFLKDEFESQFNDELRSKEKMFKEEFLQPYMDSLHLTSEADVEPSAMKTLKEDFVNIHGPLEVDAATKQAMFVDFADESYADTAKRKELYDAFLKTLKEPDEALKKKWKVLAQEGSKLSVDDPDMLLENLQENFIQNYTGEHMAGRKKGFWSTVAKQYFQNGLLELFQ